MWKLICPEVITHCQQAMKLQLLRIEVGKHIKYMETYICPEVITHCQLTMKLQLLIKTKLLKNVDFLTLKPSDVVFIML